MLLLRIVSIVEPEIPDLWPLGFYDPERLTLLDDKSFSVLWENYKSFLKLEVWSFCKQFLLGIFIKLRGGHDEICILKNQIMMTR
jgi:hypothetical protein